jgi:MFS family permease
MGGKTVEQKKYQVGGASAVGTLIVLSLLYFINFADRSIMAVALTPIKQSFSLTDAQAGLLGSLVTLGIAVLTIPAAIFGDRWARRKVVMVMGLLWSFFTLVTGLAAQFWHLAVARFMVGSGEAGYSPVGLAWIGVSFRKEMRSLILGIFFAVGQLGAVAGLILGGALIAATQDWRVPFYVFAVPGVILAISALFLRDYKVVKAKDEAVLSKKYFKDWGQIFKIKSFWLISAVYTLFFFMVYSLTTWIPSLMIRGYGMNVGQAGLTYGLITITVIFGPLGGFLADKWQKRSKNGRPYYIAVTAFLAIALFLITLLNVGSPLPVFLTLLTVASIVLALNIPVGLTIIQDTTPPGLRSTATGFVTFINMVGATLGIYYAGAVSDALGGGAHGLQFGLIYTMPFAAVAVICAFIMAKYYHADSAKVSDELLAEK